MKNPFKLFRSSPEKSDPAPVPEPPEEITTPIPPEPEPEPPKEITTPTPPEPEPEPPVEQPDPFTEWCRSQIRGGIERRERNDIFEAYNVYGVDEKNRLTCRHYHRYPEHERDFDLSYTRALTFDELNRRLLSDLDKGDVKLPDYNDCIKKARDLCELPTPETPDFNGFTDDETAALKAFCEAFDTLTDKEYRTADGVFCFSCRSVVGDEVFNLRFRKPLPDDALFSDVSGVGKTPIQGYDIESLWIMGIYNRLSERAEKCRVTLLSSEWSLKKESVFLMQAEDFPSIDGTLLLAVADETSFPKFGFYSLDFSNK